MQNQKIRVAFDFSVLGLGFERNIARTGVYRVVESIATQLLNFDNIELFFYISQNNYVQCLSYFKKRLSKANLSFEILGL